MVSRWHPHQKAYKGARPQRCGRAPLLDHGINPKFSAPCLPMHLAANGGQRRRRTPFGPFGPSGRPETCIRVHTDSRDPRGKTLGKNAFPPLEPSDLTASRPVSSAACPALKPHIAHLRAVILAVVHTLQALRASSLLIGHAEPRFAFTLRKKRWGFQKKNPAALRRRTRARKRLRLFDGGGEQRQAGLAVGKQQNVGAVHGEFHRRFFHGRGFRNHAHGRGGRRGGALLIDIQPGLL